MFSALFLEHPSRAHSYPLVTEDMHPPGGQRDGVAVGSTPCNAGPNQHVETQGQQGGLGRPHVPLTFYLACHKSVTLSVSYISHLE